MSSCSRDANGVDSLANLETSRCRTGCPTQNCGSYAACLKAANFQTQVGEGVQINRQGEKDLAAYREARRQGLQPQSVRRPFVEATKKAAGA